MTDSNGIFCERQRAHADGAGDAALDRRPPVADADAQDHRLHLGGPRPRAQRRRRLAGPGGGARAGDDLRAAARRVRLGRVDGAGTGRRPDATRRSRTRGSASSPASTRGTVFPVVGSADNAFARLALELSGYYLLSFEPESGDRDGKPHKIKVRVPGRSGVDIRARSQFSIDAPGSRTDDAILKETLQAPMLASEIGLKLATYTLRDPGERQAPHPDGRRDRSLGQSRRQARARLQPRRRQGTARSTARSIAQVKTPISPETAIQRYTGFILSDATGTHTLKIAVVDERGRRGSVEHSFRAALTPVGAAARDRPAHRRRPDGPRAAPRRSSAASSRRHGERLHRALLRRRRRAEEHDRDVRGRAGRAGTRARRRRRPSAAGDGRRAEPARARGIDPARASAAGRLRRARRRSAPTDGRSARSRARFASAATARGQQSEAGRRVETGVRPGRRRFPSRHASNASTARRSSRRRSSDSSSRG